MEAIHINMNPGRIAYEAWAREMCDYPYDEWDDLTEVTQDIWQDIAEAAIEDRVNLPKHGVEVMFRTNDGKRTFAWVGAADTQMKDLVIECLFKAMSGELK